MIPNVVNLESKRLAFFRLLVVLVMGLSWAGGSPWVRGSLDQRHFMGACISASFLPG
jgi:hypothetical protein